MACLRSGSGSSLQFVSSGCQCAASAARTCSERCWDGLAGQAGRAACPSATGGPASWCGSSLPILADQPEIGSYSWHRYVWESKADGSFAVSEDTEGEPLGRGTQINIYLKARLGARVCLFQGGRLFLCCALAGTPPGKAGLVWWSRYRLKAPQSSCCAPASVQCNTAGFSGLRAAGVCMPAAAAHALQSMPFPPSQLFFPLRAPQS